jgi:hypothetical protein
MISSLDDKDMSILCMISSPYGRDMSLLYNVEIPVY